MIIRNLAPLPLLLGLGALVSCSAAPSTEGEDRGATASTDQALASAGPQECPPASSYFVLEFAPQGGAASCPPVGGADGTWEFAGADAGTTTCVDQSNLTRGTPFVCLYQWTPDSRRRTAEPDVGALDALPNVYVAPDDISGGGSCSEPSFSPYAALLDRADVKCTGGGQTGPRGCDVCGVRIWPGVVSGNLWLATSSTLGTVIVGLSNGSMQVVTVTTAMTNPAPTTPRTNRSYVELSLPRLPRGVSYVDGPALGYGYSAPAK